MIREAIDTLLTGQGKVLVVGLGITGIEAALFLKRCGIEALCVEKSSQEEYLQKSKFKDRLEELVSKGIALHFGIEGESVAGFLQGVTLAVLSPGVSLESAIVGTLRRHSVRFVSELELGIVLAGIPAIGVTGSNGKTTTATLIHHLLNFSGIPSLLCGNVGTPVLSALSPDDVRRGKTDKYEYLVVEASSYQLESCEVIKPKIAVFLNLSDNHLERHGSMQRYLEAKARIFSNQDSNDLAILNADDPWALRLGGRLSGEQAWFGRGGLARTSANRATVEYNPGAGTDLIDCNLRGQVFRFEAKGTRLLGAHNRYDISAALIAALAAGGRPEALQAALIAFEPLEHRLEFVGEMNQVLFVNDSKSTTVAASLAAIQALSEAMPQRPVLLLLGGLVKAGSWAPLMQAVKSPSFNLRGTICFGGDRKVLSSHCDAYGISHQVARNLAEAVEMASAAAEPGDVVLLSPGCASYDEFSDFEERGRVFKSLVVSRQAA